MSGESVRGGKRTRSSYARKTGYREQYQRILIVCEGAETEPNYFEKFPIPRPNLVIVEGTGFNTKSLVEETKRIRAAREARDHDTFDQVWCVFDRDSFPREHYIQAIKNARRAGFRVAYSNEAFELWFLLHFSPSESRLGRAQYAREINSQVTVNHRELFGKGKGWRYRKNRTDMYEMLLPLQPDAIRNARRLLEAHPNWLTNPSTTVHLLVEELNLLIR